jgi:hypothetical protein
MAVEVCVQPRSEGVESRLDAKASILEPRWKSVPMDVAASRPIAAQIAASTRSA